jgi:DDE superfamily endonuclease
MIEQPLQHPDDVTAIYRVVLFIDGFIVKIQRPDGAGDAYFCGRHGKSCDSINVQYVTDLKGRVRHVITGLSGSTHDKTAASWSAELRVFLDALPPSCVVLGDPAYRGLHPKVITTFTGNHLCQQHLAFNNECTRLRQIVERSIGASQLKWRVQQLKENRIAAKKNVVFASRCTLAAAVLHNRFTNFL